MVRIKYDSCKIFSCFVKIVLTWLEPNIRPVCGSTSQKLIWIDDLSLAPIKRFEAEHLRGMYKSTISPLSFCIFVLFVSESELLAHLVICAIRSKRTEFSIKALSLHTQGTLYKV